MPCSLWLPWWFDHFILRSRREDSILALKEPSPFGARACKAWLFQPDGRLAVGKHGLGPAAQLVPERRGAREKEKQVESAVKFVREGGVANVAASRAWRRERAALSTTSPRA